MKVTPVGKSMVFDRDSTSTKRPTEVSIKTMIFNKAEMVSREANKPLDTTQANKHSAVILDSGLL